MTNPTLNRAQRREMQKRIRALTPAAPKAARPGAMKPLPTPRPKLQVYVRLMDTPREEGLLLLTALRVLKDQHRQVDFHLVTGDPGLYALAEGRWFLAGRHLLSAREEPDAGEYGIVLDLPSPDPQAALQEEERRYAAAYSQHVGQLQAQKAQLEGRGITDVRIEIPPYAFYPTWDRQHAYVWHVAAELGLPVEVPAQLQPFGELPKALEARAAQALQKAGIGVRPFFLLGFGGLLQPLDLQLAATDAFPEFQPVTSTDLQEIAQVTGIPDLVLFLAAARSPQCQLAVGSEDLLLHVAWAGGVQYLLTLYSGDNLDWDGVHAAHSLGLSATHWTPEQLPAMLAQACQVMRTRLSR